MSTLEEKLREAIVADLQQRKERNAIEAKIDALRKELRTLEQEESRLFRPFMESKTSTIFHEFVREEMEKLEKENS